MSQFQYDMDFMKKLLYISVLFLAFCVIIFFSVKNNYFYNKRIDSENVIQTTKDSIILDMNHQLHAISTRVDNIIYTTYVIDSVNINKTIPLMEKRMDMIFNKLRKIEYNINNPTKNK